MAACSRAARIAAVTAAAIVIAASAWLAHFRADALMDRYAGAWAADAYEEVDPRWEGV